MRWILIIILFSILTGCSNSVNRIPFVFDANGNKTTLEGQKHVLMFMVPDCPWAQRYYSEFERLSKKHTLETFKFALILPGKDYKTADLRDFQQLTGCSLPIYRDPEFRLTKWAKATISPEFFVIDEHSQLKYGGAFDNRVNELGIYRLEADTSYLQQAILNLEQGLQINPARTKAIGCYLEYE